jgi:hypothetical protein
MTIHFRNNAKGIDLDSIVSLTNLDNCNDKNLCSKTQFIERDICIKNSFKEWGGAGGQQL